MRSVLFVAAAGYNLATPSLRALTPTNRTTLQILAHLIRTSFDDVASLDQTLTAMYHGWNIAITYEGWNNWGEVMDSFNPTIEEIYEALFRAATAMGRNGARQGVFQLAPDTQTVSVQFPHGQWISFTLTRRIYPSDIQNVPTPVGG